MKLNIVTLPGDGIGPEVTAEAVKVLVAVAGKYGHELAITEHVMGGIALDQGRDPLPDETLSACLASGAVLLGAVGGPKYDPNPRGRKPEDGLLKLRRELGGFANLRPVKTYDELASQSPLKSEVCAGCDLVIVRELLGGLYYSTPRGFEGAAGAPARAFNTMSYSVPEIERIGRIAFELAMQRRRKLTSVDKANVLEVSELWRSTILRMAHDYPQVQLDHMLVDSCAMQLVRNPGYFDVIVTENMFGDILSDEAAVVAGSIGMLASASLGGRVGLYEPVHGSAPDIARTGKANPLGAIASAALMLRHSFGLEREALLVEEALGGVLAKGLRTPDLASDGPSVSTVEMGDAVASFVRAV